MATPTLDLGPATGIYGASGFTLFAAGATVTDGTDKILGVQIRIASGSASLGIVESGVLKTTGTIGKIDYNYSAGTKLLQLKDNTGAAETATATDFQSVLRSMGISDATGSVSISANLGQPVYDALNGHYYQFVPFTPGNVTSWTNSNAEVTGRQFLGLQGYLATITSVEENSFLTASFDSKGWIGGKATYDSSNNRIWTWVGGPEAGKSFWIGNADGSSTSTDIKYTNWLNGEPNNFGGTVGSNTTGEPYAQFTVGAQWNDLADSPDPNQMSQFIPNGYWIEYSTADGTPDTSLAATRDTISLAPGSPGPSAPDLVFYDPAAGKVSFAFVGANNTIVSEGLTGDTPVLTNNASSATPEFGSNWRMVSANVDVDKDGVKDLIVANKIDNSVVVFFGENRTSTLRQYAYTRSAAVTSNGAPIAPGTDWTLSFASNKIGTNDSPGLFWFNNKNGISAIWTLKPVTTAGVTTVGLETSGVIFNAGANSGWIAIGDGEFNQDATTREVFWMNEKSSQIVTWSLAAASRTLTSGKLAWDGLVSTSAFKVVGISSVNGTGNDNIIWQTGSTIVVWNMKDGAYSAPGSVAFAITASDRIKAVADVDGDNVLDLIGQNDGNGTIASYSLTANFALKNTSAPRAQYASNNVAGYRPAKGGLNGSQLELVNVAQYDSPNNVA